jgi:cyclopropane fatty-acyl-phospholipid synthase-like methyltransferase
MIEPELMDDREQARAYARADFEEPNAAFVRHLRAHFEPLPERAKLVDLGCGPGDIAVRLARAFPGWTIDAMDGSAAMLQHAREAVQRAGVAERVRLIQQCVPSARLPTDGYDIVLSNSLLHHLHDPGGLWATVARVGCCGARVMVVDLFRPHSPEAARSIVETYSGAEPQVLKRDFFNSLLAAFTPDEIRAQVATAGLDGLQVHVISDRHVLVVGRLPAEPTVLAAIRYSARAQVTT